MSDLKEFQVAAVARICERLDAEDGSRRFLLADEVGLGKTMVARGVLEVLSDRNTTRNGIVCVYLCSNLEIAEQNRDKLNIGGESGPATRLTLITLHAKAIHEARRQKKFQLFLFTPGTSLKLGGSTGMKSERRLLLACLYGQQPRQLGAKLANWIEFFRCGAGQQSAKAKKAWVESCAPDELRREVVALWESRLYAKLINRWKQGVISVRYRDDQRPAERNLLDAVHYCVGDFVDAPSNEQEQRRVRRNRNAIIGELRKGVAEAALSFLAPDLILVDEFQRFKDVIELAKQESELAFKLFDGPGEPRRVLILSATPYKAVTFEHEREKHYEDFQRTLSFLLGRKPNKVQWLSEVNALLLDFKDKLTGGSTDLAGLIHTKEQLERRLKEVMCRTERSRYLLDDKKGVEDFPDLSRTVRLPVPLTEAISEFVCLRSFLQKYEKGERPFPSIMDYWKSCSSVVTFMDSGYVLIRRLKEDKVRVDAKLLRPEAQLVGLSKYNLKMQTLVAGVREPCQLDEINARHWRYLWARPTYFYHRDEFFGDADPTKFLVFSRWRFVPKAISFVVSREFESGLRAGKEYTRALELNSESLKVCLPLLSLVDLIDPATWAAERIRSHKGIEPSSADFRKYVRTKLKTRLKAAGIRISKKAHRAGYWPALFELERQHMKALADSNAGGKNVVPLDLYTVLAQAVAPQDSEKGEQAQVSEFLRIVEPWIGGQTTDFVFPAELLEEVVTMTLASPAVCLLRAIRSLFRKKAEDVLPLVSRVCFQDLRTYLNKGYVQEIVGRHTRSGRYADQVLSYSFDAHFQSVIDEYAYLLFRVLQRDTIDRFVRHVGRVFALGSGAPNINVPTGRNGRIKEGLSQRSVNFSMAFGEEKSPDETAEDHASRKTSVRESFNSPFWPFVLATTSIGQEGLDFHLYCRDVMHWNLPSNPVDLEQREGRINRFDGLVVRKNIRLDYSLSKIAPEGGGPSNLWDRIFQQVEAHPTGGQQFKHGLFPHWVYEPAHGDPVRIRRHLAIFEGSRDRMHYERLKKYLYYYRLAFGQARQQDLLDRIVDRPDEARLRKDLQACMVNLSPFPDDYPWKKAQRDARELVTNADSLREIVEGTRRLFSERPAELREAAIDLEALWQVAERVLVNGHIDQPEDVKSIAALVYLLNPYDEKFDGTTGVGLLDDVAIIRNVGASNRKEVKIS